MSIELKKYSDKKDQEDSQQKADKSHQEILIDDSCNKSVRKEHKSEERSKSTGRKTVKSEKDLCKKEQKSENYLDGDFIDKIIMQNIQMISRIKEDLARGEIITRGNKPVGSLTDTSRHLKKNLDNTENKYGKSGIANWDSKLTKDNKYNLPKSVVKSLANVYSTTRNPEN